MDIATILGIVGGFAVLVGAVLIEGSHLSQFMNLLATMVVICGAMMAVLIRYPLAAFVHALILGLKSAFLYHHTSPRDLLNQIADLADVVRKNGPIGLEKVTVEDPFLAKGLQMIADGFALEVLVGGLERERDLQIERLEEAHKIFKALGEAAPGMGMVGTLIGLVSMFSHMDDPKKIGPGMAIALLTTLYGAVISNLVALPISDKLSNRAGEEATNRSLIIDGLIMIKQNQSSSLIKDMLMSYLPHHHRSVLQETLADAA